MTQINLITPPDKLHSDSPNILVIFPGKEVQTALQNEILTEVKDSLNLYYFNRSEYSKQDYDWLFDVFALCDYCVIDVDQCPPIIKDLLGYFIAKTKTYWLTNAENSVYNHISKNRVYNLDFLKNIGD